MPRKIYGLSSMVLLVGQILHCGNGHQITTYDPRIVDMFSDRMCVPFVLFHRSGVTRELVQQIFTQASLGTHFKDIEDLVILKDAFDAPGCTALFLPVVI